MKIHINDLLAVGSEWGRVPVEAEESSKLDQKDSTPAQWGIGFLPGAQVEVNRIRDVFGPRIVTVVGRGYTKHELFNSIGHFGFIHIASHSNWDSQYPSASSLLLNGNDKDDGAEESVLRALEMTGIDSRARILVLSACNSARWSSNARNYGFLRSVRMGDIVSIIGTVWPIDDEATPVLMERFYLHLKEGVSIGRALRLAKLDLVHSGRNDPFYWAGFILVGQNVALEFQQAGNTYLEDISLVSIAIALLIVPWGRFRRIR